MLVTGVGPYRWNSRERTLRLLGTDGRVSSRSGVAGFRSTPRLTMLAVPTAATASAAAAPSWRRAKRAVRRDETRTGTRTLREGASGGVARMCFASAWISERCSRQSPHCRRWASRNPRSNSDSSSSTSSEMHARVRSQGNSGRLLASTFSYDGVAPGKLELRQDASETRLAPRLASGLPETPDSAATGSSGLTTSAK